MRLARLLLSITLPLATAAGCSAPADLAREPPVPPAVALGEPLLALRLREASRAVRDAPGSAALWGRLGEVYDANGFDEPALACYARAAELDPRDWRWPYASGLLRRPTDPAAALSELARAAGLRPDYAALQFHLGFAHYLAESLDEAQHSFERALDLDPACLNARLGLARVALARGDPPEALAQLERAAREAPEVAAVHLYLAQVYHELDRHADAEREERLTVTSPRPALPDGFAALDDPLREELRTREGVGAARLLADARRLMLEGRNELAERAVARALEADPRSITALVVSARLLATRGDLAAARAQLERARSVDPRSVEARVELGAILATVGEIEPAIEVLREALAIDPRLARVKSNLAGLLFRAGRAREAHELLLEARRDLPDDADVRAQLATVRRELGYSEGERTGGGR